MRFFYLAGVVGIEPTNAGIKIQCLTTWRHPKKLNLFLQEDVYLALQHNMLRNVMQPLYTLF